ncbi:hypothetical protein D1007_54606 [Hordeum vulgare]|nr:hypothetical protein D1007_54606 [Hordeum vulgare]
MWRDRRYHEERDVVVVNSEEYKDIHLKWFDDGIKYRLHVRPEWTAADMTPLEVDNPEEEDYNANVRENQGELREYAPLLNRMSFELNKSNFGGPNPLVHASRTDQSGSSLSFLKPCQCNFSPCEESEKDEEYEDVEDAEGSDEGGEEDYDESGEENYTMRMTDLHPHSQPKTKGSLIHIRRFGVHHRSGKCVLIVEKQKKK